MTSGIYSPSNSNSLDRRIWNRLPRKRIDSSPIEVVEIYFAPLQRRILQEETLPIAGSWSARFKARCNHLQLSYRR